MIAPLIAPATPIATKPSLERNVDWAGVLRQASLALAFQQAFRVAAQPKTRAELGGPFWKDYGASLRGIRGWRDGDSTFTNYFAHPMMGSMAGYIYLANDRRGEVEFGASRRYWATRLRATGFSAAYSTVFEIGPLSEASVGNVGLHSGTNGAVDFVMTPVGGLGWMVAEDALDKHVIQPIERGANNRWISATLRCVLNPSRSMSHLSRLEPPWRRSGRTLRE
ncbi:MAG: hypothetical protein GC160_19355 [Acidobacteria bacterium]|nr:hypothetical protein [Acidobacteriota bacterium]